MRRLPSNLLKKNDTPGCEYHTHKPAEACYKNMILPKESIKEERLASQCSRSRKDAEEVLAYAKANGVKIIDWEDQRAEANRKLLEQTGRRHIGFGRLMRSGPEVTQACNGAGESVRQGHEPHPRPLASTRDLFGTAQTSGAVDDVLGELPSYSPSTAAHVALLAAAACTTPAENILPADETDNELVSEPESGAQSANNLNSASIPDSDLRGHLEMTLGYERQLGCPGAFPLSRNGSKNEA